MRGTLLTLAKLVDILIMSITSDFIDIDDLLHCFDKCWKMFASKDA